MGGEADRKSSAARVSVYGWVAKVLKAVSIFFRSFALLLHLFSHRLHPLTGQAQHSHIHLSPSLTTVSIMKFSAVVCLSVLAVASGEP